MLERTVFRCSGRIGYVKNRRRHFPIRGAVRAERVERIFSGEPAKSRNTYDGFQHGYADVGVVFHR